MTLFKFIKQCLQKEAARTEPDGKFAVEKVLKEIGKGWGKRK